MKKENETCPKCGTVGCMSSKEYKKHLEVTGAGQLRVRGGASTLVKTCKFRQDMKKMREFREKQEQKRLEDKWLR